MPAILRRFHDLPRLSQQELADSTGVSKGFISAPDGGRIVANLERLLQIADALQVSPGTIVDALAREIENMDSS